MIIIVEIIKLFIWVVFVFGASNSFDASPASSISDESDGSREWFIQIFMRSVEGVDSLNLDPGITYSSVTTPTIVASSAIDIVRLGKLLADKHSEEAIRTAQEAGDWPLYQTMSVNYAMILDEADPKRLRLLSQAVDVNTSVTEPYYSAVAALELLQLRNQNAGEDRMSRLKQSVKFIANHITYHGLQHYRTNYLIDTLAIFINSGQQDITLDDVVRINREVGDVCGNRLKQISLKDEVSEPISCSGFGPDFLSSSTLNLFKSILEQGYSPQPSCLRQ